MKNKLREFWVRTINGVQYAKDQPSKVFCDGIHVREVDPKYDALVEEMIENLQFYRDWYERTLKNNENVKKQRGDGSFGHVQHDVDVALRGILSKLSAYRAKEKSE